MLPELENLPYRDCLKAGNVNNVNSALQTVSDMIEIWLKHMWCKGWWHQFWPKLLCM